MKKKLLYASPVLLILWILLTGWNVTRAQDLIYYYSGEIAQVNLIEITDEHIIFAPYGQPEYDVVKIDKTQVKRVVQNQNGKKVEINFTRKGYVSYRYASLRWAPMSKKTDSASNPLSTERKDSVLENQEVAENIITEPPEKVEVKDEPLPQKEEVVVETQVIPEVSAKEPEEKVVKSEFEEKPEDALPSKPVILEIPYKSALKLSLTSFLTNHLEVSYEWRLRDHIGLEVTGGLIGLSLPGDWAYERISTRSEYLAGKPFSIKIDETRKQDNGYFLRVGPKFTFTQKNSLVGLYVKPEFVFNTYQARGYVVMDVSGYGENTTYEYDWKYKGNYIGGMASFGYQMVLGKRIVVDANVGVGSVHVDGDLEVDGELPEGYEGYEIPAKFISDYDLAIHYSHFSQSWLAFNANLSIGLLIVPEE